MSAIADRIVLVCLANAPYLPMAKQVFASAYFKGGWEGDFCLMAFEVPDEELRWFRHRGIFVHETQALDPELQGADRVIHSKIEVFGNFFHQWKQVVFLDLDMIIRHSLQTLTEPITVAGVRGWGLPTLNHRIRRFPKSPESDQLVRELEQQIDPQWPTINGGLIAYRPKAIPTDSLLRMKEMYFRFKPVLQSYDEFLVGAFFSDSLTFFPRSYNDLSFSRHRPYKGSHILHFAGKEKPWMTSSPFHSEWSANLAQAEDIFRRPPQTVCLSSRTRLIQRLMLELRWKKNLLSRKTTAHLHRWMRFKKKLAR